MKLRGSQLAVLSAVSALFVAAPAWGQNYQYSSQYAFGQPAQFNMTGPATQGDPEGDALIESVQMPDGSVFDTFYRPVGISHFTYSGDGHRFSAFGGSNCTIGYNYEVDLKDVVNDGGGNNETPADIAAMPPHILAVLESGQRVGAVAIDLSRLGVSETSYLCVMKPQSGVGGYTSGERRPDFKVMAVITHPSQLSTVAALFD